MSLPWAKHYHVAKLRDGKARILLFFVRFEAIHNRWYVDLEIEARSDEPIEDFAFCLNISPRLSPSTFVLSKLVWMCRLFGLLFNRFSSWWWSKETGRLWQRSREGESSQLNVLLSTVVRIGVDWWGKSSFPRLTGKQSAINSSGLSPATDQLKLRTFSGCNDSTGNTPNLSRCYSR